MKKVIKDQSFENLKTGHEIGRTKHFGVSLLENFKKLVKYFCGPKPANIIGYF